MRRLVRAFGPVALTAAPFVWVSTELGRSYIFIGFPWALLGYSQASVLPIAQSASLFGVYGVSALVAASSAAAAGWVTRPAGERWQPVVATMLLLAVLAGWGAHRAAVAEWTHTGVPVRVGLVQGNVDQAQKFDAVRAAATFRAHLEMTRLATRLGASLVVWPESSTPFLYQEDPVGANQLRSLARSTHAAILFGSDQIERGTPRKYYNAAFFVDANGADAGVYRKMHLVPFGEYVPFKRVFFFAAPLVEAVADFSPGQTPTVFAFGPHRLSTAICYEIVYGSLVRRFVQGGSELLTTITNDAWFGPTSAPYQHFEQASMRAIEEGRYLVRAANTGISGIVDPYGHVVERTAIYESALTVGEARFLQTGTLYAHVGDVFAYASVALTLALAALSGRRVQ
jgi:apolipoprotein N-acyltransferase